MPLPPIPSVPPIPPFAGFTLRMHPLTASVVEGSSQNFEISVAKTTLPAPGPLSLSVSGLPPGFTATFAPSTLAVGPAPVASTLTITAPRGVPQAEVAFTVTASDGAQALSADGVLRVQPELDRFLDLLHPAGPPQNCTVQIQNLTTPDREVLVIAAGVHFDYFRDGPAGGLPFIPDGDYMAGPVHVELPAGASASFRSTDPRKRVGSIRVGVKARFGENIVGKFAEFNYFKTIPLPPGERFVEVRVDLRVAETALAIPARPYPFTQAFPPFPLPPSQAPKWIELVKRPYP